MQPPAKRLKVVEESEPAKLAAGGKVNFAQFDDRKILRKTNLELLNLSLSKLAHTAVTLWSHDVSDQVAAAAMLTSDQGGWWIHRFPSSEVDHVWRVIVNSHGSRTMGSVVHLRSDSFAEARGEVEVRVHVPSSDDNEALKKFGAALLSLAPSSHNRQHVLFLRGGLKEGNGLTGKLDGRAAYKLQRDKRPEQEREGRGLKRPGPFAIPEPERAFYQLYKAESSPTTWVKVDI